MFKKWKIATNKMERMYKKNKDNYQENEDEADDVDLPDLVETDTEVGMNVSARDVLQDLSTAKFASKSEKEGKTTRS